MSKWILVLCGLLTSLPVFADGPADALTLRLRRPQFEQVEISPHGSVMAIAYRNDGGTVVTVVGTADMAPVTQINPGPRAEVSGMVWLDDQRLLVAANRSTGPYAVPIVEPALFLVDLHRKHPVILPHNLVGLLEGDPSHVLISTCANETDHGECRWEVRRVDLDHPYGDGTLLATAPIGDASFLVDHAGVVRFAWGYTDKARSRLFARNDSGEWTLVNDSDTTHLHVVPLAISRDNRTAFLDSEQPSGPDEIERYDLATGTRTPWLRDPVSDPLQLITSADGRQPVGAWFGPGKPEARFRDPDDPDTRFAASLVKAFPGGMVEVASATDDGNLLVVHSWSDRDSGTFYLLDRKANKARLLFHARPWEDPAQLAATTPIALEARDGVPLHGFVTRPPGQTGPGPMVVMVHGGPYYVQDEWTYDQETQLLATHGYTVLRVNFRGSSGFGLDFMQRGYRQWGGRMEDDVIDATRWAIGHGLAQADRICIYGASYGAYAALMAVAQEPDLYRCAAGLAGVYDLNRLYRWGDIHRSDYGKYYLDLVLGKDTAELSARSPVTLAARIKVPVLLAHGNLDGRVPVKYAAEMRRAMRKAGHPVTYLTYDWEGHGLYDPEHRHDFYSHLLDFLAASLQPAATAGAPAAATAGVSATAH